MTTATLDRNTIIVTADPVDNRRVMDIPGVKRIAQAPLRCRLDCTLDNLRALRSLPARLDDSLTAAQKQLERVEKWIEREKRNDAPNPLKPAPVKKGITLYNHQIRAYNMCLVLQTFAAFMDMGTGKTLTMIAVTGRRFLDGKIKRVLIVAPTSVCAVWPAEYAKFADFPHRVSLLLGEREKRIQALKALTAPVPPGITDPLRVAVINYESTWRLENELITYAPDMIICDESQRIKGHKASQSEAMHRIGTVARYRVLLSGTPMQNNPCDFWSQYQFLNPTIFGQKYYAFQRRYAIMGGPEKQIMLGTKNLDELTRKVHSIAYRVTKAECLDLPEKTFEAITVQLPDKTMSLYKRIRRESFLTLEQGEVTATNVLVRLTRLRQIAGGFLTDDEGNSATIHSAKLDALEDLLTDYVQEGSKKVVIFACYIPETQAIEALLDRMKIKHVSIRGEVPIRQRGDIVRRFQEEKGPMVFVGQIDAAAEGITLIPDPAQQATGAKMANIMVYYSHTFNLSKYLQSQDRIHRIGQTNKCTYLHLVCPGTIDEKIMGALQRKEDMARSITDNWKQFFTEE